MQGDSRFRSFLVERRTSTSCDVSSPANFGAFPVAVTIERPTLSSMSRPTLIGSSSMERSCPRALKAMSMADGQNAKPRTRSPLSPSAFEFLPTFHREGVSKLFVSAKTAGAIPVLSPAIGDALVLASLDAKVRSIGFIASARRGKEHVDLDVVVVVQRGDRLFFMDVVAARRIRDLEDEGLALIALEEFELSPWRISAQTL